MIACSNRMYSVTGSETTRARRIFDPTRDRRPYQTDPPLPLFARLELAGAPRGEIRVVG